MYLSEAGGRLTSITGFQLEVGSQHVHSCVASMTSHNPHMYARMHRDTRQRHVALASSLFSSFLLHVLIKTRMSTCLL